MADGEVGHFGALSALGGVGRWGGQARYGKFCRPESE